MLPLIAVAACSFLLCDFTLGLWMNSRSSSGFAKMTSEHLPAAKRDMYAGLGWQ